MRKLELSVGVALAAALCTVGTRAWAGDPSGADSSTALAGKKVAQAAPTSEAAPPAGEGGPAAAPSVGAPATVTLGTPGTSTPSTPAATKDTPQAAAPPNVDQAEAQLPFRKSTFFLDQSVTTQSVGVGGVPQSQMPVYEWWLSFRPRWYFNDHISLRGRWDYYKEFTNSDNGRTDYREDSFGDIWTDLVYASPLDAKENTNVAAGVRALWPISKQSQDEGVYVQAGLTATGTQKIPLNGENAPFFDDVTLRLSAWYNHPFSQATTPVNGSLNYVRQDTDGRSFFLSDQLSGSTLINHQLLTALGGTLQITPKIDLDLNMIFIQQWHYTPTGGANIQTSTGNAPVADSTAPTYVVDTWFIAALDYDPIDDVSFSLGYYNLQNELSYQANQRTLFGSDNIWWSPDARFFFTITAHLDSLYTRFSGHADQTLPETRRNVSSASSPLHAD